MPVRPVGGIGKPPVHQHNHSDMANKMGLVDYSDSDDGGEMVSSQQSSAALGKRKRVDDQSHLPSEQPERSSALPPLPSRFHDLYVSASRIGTGDDPSLHGGRMRAIPHVEGNWATHVYLECKPPSNSILFPVFQVASLRSKDYTGGGIRADLNRRAS
jgi:hypothetical protein